MSNILKQEAPQEVRVEGDSVYSKKLDDKLPNPDVLHDMFSKPVGEGGAGAGTGAPAGQTADEDKAKNDSKDQDLGQGEKADETIKMLCKEHGAPAVFFSQQ